MTVGASQAQMLMGRKLRSIISTATRQLRTKFKAAQYTQKTNYDKTAKPLKSLDIGKPVTIRDSNVWSPAIVTGKVDPGHIMSKPQRCYLQAKPSSFITCKTK